MLFNSKLFRLGDIMSKFVCLLAALACASVAVQAAPAGKEAPQSDNDTFPVRLILRRHSAQIRKMKYCAGVRISEEWLLTAAECFDNQEHKYIQISFPDQGTYKEKHYEVERDTQKPRDQFQIKIHPKYNTTSKANNLAVVRVDFGPTSGEAKPVALPFLKDGKTSYQDEHATVYTYDGGDFDTLRHVSVRDATVVSKNFCSGGPLFFLDTEKYICARVYGEKPVTMNDVGAPLVYQATENTTKKLIGILSSELEITGLLANTSMQFTRIYGHLEWISTATGIKLRKDF